jgi:hypothetical protein
MKDHKFVVVFAGELQAADFIDAFECDVPEHGYFKELKLATNDDDQIPVRGEERRYLCRICSLEEPKIGIEE